MVSLEENYFQEGVQLFLRGGGGERRGSNCLFPIETHITCDFLEGGGVLTLCPPPSGSELDCQKTALAFFLILSLFYTGLSMVYFKENYYLLLQDFGGGSTFRSRRGSNSYQGSNFFQGGRNANLYRNT